MELDPINYVKAQIASISNIVDSFIANYIQSNFICQICARNHMRYDVSQGIFSIPQALNQTTICQIINRIIHIKKYIYNPGWRDYPKFSWSYNQGFVAKSLPYAPHEEKASIEKMFNAFI